MTKLGKFMYNLVLKWSNMLMKHHWLWVLLNLTWGILLTLPTTIFGLILSFKYKSQKYFWTRCLQFGDNWGGFEGSFFIFVANNMGEEWTEHTRQHEFGHSFQNALFGPLTIFIVTIPSIIRYWYRRLFPSKCSTKYDDIWFEGSATCAGENATYYLSFRK